MSILLLETYIPINVNNLMPRQHTSTAGPPSLSTDQPDQRHTSQAAHFPRQLRAESFLPRSVGWDPRGDGVSYPSIPGLMDLWASCFTHAVYPRRTQSGREA